MLLSCTLNIWNGEKNEGFKWIMHSIHVKEFCLIHTYTRSLEFYLSHLTYVSLTYALCNYLWSMQYLFTNNWKQLLLLWLRPAVLKPSETLGTKMRWHFTQQAEYTNSIFVNHPLVRGCSDGSFKFHFLSTAPDSVECEVVLHTCITSISGCIKVRVQKYWMSCTR